MMVQLLSETCGSCSRWQGHELALKTVAWKWHLSRSLVKANDVARSDCSRVAVHGVLPQWWVSDTWISDTVQRNRLVIAPSKAWLPGVTAHLLGGLSPGKHVLKGRKNWGLRIQPGSMAANTGSFFLSFILVFLILGEYLIGSHGLKFKTQKDIKRGRFPYLLLTVKNYF